MTTAEVHNAYRHGWEDAQAGIVAGMLITISAGIVGFLLGWIAHMVIR